MRVALQTSSLKTRELWLQEAESICTKRVSFTMFEQVVDLEQYGAALCLSKAVDLDRWTDWRPTRSNWFVLPTSASLSQIKSQDKDGIALAKIWSSKSLDWFELRLCLQALTRCFVECDDHTVMKHAYTAQKGSKRPDGFKYSVYDSLIDLTETNELCPNGCFVAFAHACWLSICSATVVGGHLSWLINL